MDAGAAAATIDPVLTCDGIAAAYPSESSRRILTDVGIAIRPGELAAIVGPNGSGKSTLVQTLSRVLRPTGGAVLLDARDLYSAVSAREAASAIGVVPQSTDVFLDFTVRDIVAMGRAPRRAARGLLGADSAEDAAAVDRALIRMQVDSDLASRPIGQVSGGERQRALIARMLAQEARVLLLDEPTAALDLAAQSRLMVWLRRLAREESRAVVVVLHDLNTAAEYADRIVVLDRGRVAAQGPASDVLTAQMIRDVYGVRTWVRANPVTGRPMIVRIDRDDSGSESSVLAGKRIHLFCGAGFGAGMMFRLHAFGADLSVSIVQRGDQDEEAARALGLRLAAADPFCAPTDVVLRDAAAMAAEADAAVVCRTPIGQTNAALVGSIDEFARRGRPLVALSRDSHGQGDAITAISGILWVDAECDAIAALVRVFTGGGDVA